MPKIKSHKSIIKRFRVSGGRLVIGRRLTIPHRARFKSKRARKLAGSAIVLGKTVTKKLQKVIGG
jgi:ribosomal protein L35